MISDVIRPGDKIDMQFLHQNNGKTYKSSVLNFVTETELEVSMPTEGGKIVLFRIGIACQFYFYTQKGIYTCEITVKDRYKKGDFYVMLIKITSVPKKFQRRDFFRVDFSEEFTYYPISRDEVAAIEKTKSEKPEDLNSLVSTVEFILKMRLATTMDLSGGGMRFIADEDLEVGSQVLSVIHLANAKVDKTFYLITEIIACKRMEETPEKRIVRARFDISDPDERELIVRYVFEQDRWNRMKG